MPCSRLETGRGLGGSLARGMFDRWVMRESLEPPEDFEIVRFTSFDWGFGFARRGDGPDFKGSVIVCTRRGC